MEKLTKQLTMKYVVLQSTFWMSQCAIGGFAVVYLHSKNFDNTQIGVILSLASIFAILLQLIIAAIADKSKKQFLQHAVILLMCVTFILALILQIAPYSFLLIAVSYVLINAIQAALNPLFNSLAVEYINKGIPINYGLARGMGSISFAVTSYFLGIYITNFGPNALILIFLLSYCAVIIAAFAFNSKPPQSPGVSIHSLPESVSCDNENFSDRDTENGTKLASSGVFSFFIKYRKFTLQLLGIIMLFYSHSMICTYLINIIEHVGGNSSDMGISLAITAAVELPTMAGFIFIIKKIKCNTILKISAFFFLIKVGTAWLAPNVLMVNLSQTLQMLSYALFTPASVYYVNSIVEEQDQVKGQSMLGVAMCIAGTIANITGGKILDTLGVSDMLLFGTIIAAVGFVIVCISTEKVEITSS